LAGNSQTVYDGTTNSFYKFDGTSYKLTAFSTFTTEAWYPGNVQICSLEKGWTTFYSAEPANKKATILNYLVGGSIGGAPNVVGTSVPKFHCDGIGNMIFSSDTQLNWLSIVWANTWIAWGG